jgi:hypothetical protein
MFFCDIIFLSADTIVEGDVIMKKKEIITDLAKLLEEIKKL